MKKRPSFRTRVLAIASIVVGTVLAIVIGLDWSTAMQRQARLLDHWLCLEARRVAEPVPREERMVLESDIRDKLQLTAAERILLQADYGAAGSWHSNHWPEAFHIETLEWKAAPLSGVTPRAFPCDVASFSLSGSQWHAARVGAASPSGFVAANLADMRSQLAIELRRILLIMVPIAVTLTAVSAWLLATVVTRPVNRLQEAMKEMTPQSLDQRLSEEGADQEFRELILAYNTMLERLERSFKQASRFSANAAHELRTPLTILQGRIELSIRNTDNPEHLQLLSGLLEEVSHLSAISRKLLQLAQADAGRLALNLQTVDWSELLTTLLSDAQLLISHQVLSSDIQPQLHCMGDAILLRQLCNNLISNAARYCPAGGWIKVSSRYSENGIETLFSNSAVPVSALQRRRFFDRFYRGESVRQLGIEGSGLGLNLAREIARAHGGDLTLLAGPEDVVQLRLWLPTA